MTGQWKDAVSELETAVKLKTSNPGIQFDLARAYAKNGQPDKALQAFERLLELEPTPLRQNDVAYEMAVDKLNLDQARKYSLEAIGSLEAQMRDVPLDNLSSQDMSNPGNLASYLDTLGWVDFQRGDLKSAEKYVAAAWQLQNKGELASHLGQIYEKEGRKQDAIEAYAEGVLAAPKDQEVRDKLAALFGEASVDSTLEHARGAWEQEKELKVENPRGIDGMAEFWVELGRGKSGAGAVEIQGTKFIMGDDGLKDADGEIKTAKFGNFFSDDGDYKIVKKVRMECRKGEECKLEMDQGGKGK